MALSIFPVLGVVVLVPDVAQDRVATPEKEKGFQLVQLGSLLGTGYILTWLCGAGAGGCAEGGRTWEGLSGRGRGCPRTHGEGLS